MSCVSAAGNFLSAGLGGEALFGNVSQSVVNFLDYSSFATGTGSTFLDILNGLSGWLNPSCG